ncbi:MAG: NAD-binding protein [archaeon]
MYGIILGGSDFASDLAKFIQAREGSKIVLVLKEKEQAIEASESMGAIVVNADASDPKTLDELELEACDVFVAATPSEQTNVLAALYAKNKGAKRIFVKVESIETKRLMKKLDVALIDTEEVAARAIELMISMPAVSELVNTGVGMFDLFEIQASATKTVGRPVSEIQEEEFACLATYRDGEYSFDKDQAIEEDHILIMLTKSGKGKETTKKLKAKNWQAQKNGKSD